MTDLAYVKERLEKAIKDCADTYNHLYWHAPWELTKAIDNPIHIAYEEYKIGDDTHKIKSFIGVGEHGFAKYSEHFINNQPQF
ncbi:MAG: hypothetical protein WC475_03395 [Candidatus Paceibacterota bacterium]